MNEITGGAPARPPFASTSTASGYHARAMGNRPHAQVAGPPTHTPPGEDKR